MNTATISLDDFQQRLGYTFRDQTLLKLALTHPSICHETNAISQHNQRLEFLGDSVLELVLTVELYNRFPDLDEGPLTKARARMVNRNTLAEHARKLGLGGQLILSRGEEKSGGRERESILADAFEAVIGAIYLDRGMDPARGMIVNYFAEDLDHLQPIRHIENPKGELQEQLQAWSNEPPKYVLHSASGPDHDRLFECAVTHKGEELGRGSGKNKKAAESEAALAALETLRKKKGE